MGGWLVRRHNAGCDVLEKWLVEACDCTVFREQVLPTANRDHAEARMDVIAYSPKVAGPIHIDLTVVSALSVEALSKGSALHDGIAASIASGRKHSKCPNCRLFPFPVEDHGRFGEDALTVIRMVALGDPVARSAAIGGLYQGLASTLQRVAADSVITACRPPTR